MNKIILILLIVVLTMSIVTPLFPLVKAVTFTYGGVAQNSPSWNFTPALSFSIPKGAVLYDVGNFNLGFVAYVEFGGLQLQTGICSVSYTASWEGNQPVELYNVTLATPENLPGDLSGITTGLQQYFFHTIDLTNVPQGIQQITVTVEGGGYYLPLTTDYYTVYATASFSLDFTIKAEPSSTPAQNSTSWNLQTVSADGAGEPENVESSGILSNSPIAVDSNGVPHVAYMAYTSTVYVPMSVSTVLPNFVEYATWNNVSWSTQTVDIGTQLYSLALDSNDTPGLVWEGLNGLMYATSTGANWTIQNVDPNGASFAALAFDSAGNPHIAYDSGATVKYASWTGSIWQIQTVTNLAATAGAGQLYLAFNGSSTPYILYGYSPYDNGTELVQLATGKSGGWNIQTIPLPSPVGGFGNMVLDSKGYPHLISAQTNVNNTSVSTLFHVSWNGTGWTAQKVASNIPLQINGPDTNYIGSLALDARNNPHITYTSNGYVMYASWTGKSWNIQFVQTAAGYIGATEPGFLALDSGGDPHISFYGPIVSGADYSQGVPILAIVDVMYATAKEVSPASAVQEQPSSLPNQLIVVPAAIIAVVVAALLLLYRRNRKKQVNDKKTLSLKESGHHFYL
jgi:hypothetical protein